MKGLEDDGEDPDEKRQRMGRGKYIYRTAATAVKRIAQKQRRRSFFIVFSIFIRHRSLLSIYIYIYIYKCWK